ncbi:hypothetical protein ACFV7Q_33960 [Streptomyces sp. NPDC059851]|uniref:hypothetical protein n=1 Tax=Streptomyces sp. NPDC059851 TaxID=3346971 RepID=UPI00365A0602
MSEWEVDQAMVSRARQVKQATADRLRSYPNVTGIGVGLKETGGRPTGQIAVIVYVRRKIPDTQLRTEDRLPAEIEGIPVDVIEAEFMSLDAQDHHKRHDPLVGGISIGHRPPGESEPRNAGTLGGAFFDNANGEDMILSNWHVLCRRTTCQADDLATQPGDEDKQTVTSGDVVARLHRTAFTDRVDAAVARLTGARFLLPELLGLAPISGLGFPVIGSTVRKSGRSTGVTSGLVTAIDADVTVEITDVGHFSFLDQIAVGGLGIGDRGDSGSLVVDESNRIIGLVFAGADSHIICNQIAFVLAALDINLERGVRMHDFVAITAALLH